MKLLCGIDLLGEKGSSINNDIIETQGSSHVRSRERNLVDESDWLLKISHIDNVVSKNILCFRLDVDVALSQMSISHRLYQSQPTVPVD